VPFSTEPGNGTNAQILLTSSFHHCFSLPELLLDGGKSPLRIEVNALPPPDQESGAGRFVLYSFRAGRLAVRSSVGISKPVIDQNIEKSKERLNSLLSCGIAGIDKSMDVAPVSR